MNTPLNHERNDLAERVLKRIEGEHIAPEPRWKFLARNYLFWGLSVLAVVLNALAFSATIFEVQNTDWQLSPVTHHDPLSFFFATTPFFWLLALAVFGIAGYWYVRRTKRGYRYPLLLLLLAATLSPLVIGALLYTTGFGSVIEESVGDHPPFYRPVLLQERSWWLAPERGLLGGEVTDDDIVASSSLALRDFSGRVWEVDTSDLRDPDFAVVRSGGSLRIIGVPVASTSSSFHACFVFPWVVKGVPSHFPAPPPWQPASTTFRQREEQSSACKDIGLYQQVRLIKDR